jgi:hypothetical protein
VDFLYTHSTGKAKVVLAGLPDPKLGRVDLGVRWCRGPSNAVIDGTPSATALLTDNWVLLGALENAGFATGVTKPKVTLTATTARAKAEYFAQFEPVELALNFIPVSRALHRLSSYIHNYVVAVRHGTSPTVALRKMMKKVRDALDELEDRLEKRLANKLDSVPGISTRAAKWVANKVTDALEAAGTVMEKMIRDKVSSGDVTNSLLEKIFKRAFGTVTMKLWKVDVTVDVKTDGTHGFTNDSEAPTVVLDQHWRTETVT